MREDILDRSGLLAFTVDKVVGEPEVLPPETPLNDRVQPGEGATDDEQHIGRVDLDELLMRVLTSTLGRH